jgi:plasmid stability protein
MRFAMAPNGGINPMESTQIHNGAMPVTLSVKNVPDALAERLRKRAAEHHRSLQGELLAILEEAAQPSLTIDDLAEKVRSLGLRTRADSVAIIRAARDGRRR